MNESTIISAVCGGDIDQYAALVERYQIGLTIYCERLVGDRADAEDITQKSLTRKRGGFRPGCTKLLTTKR
jgi:DNA-directed RNA polymerase specialized sigma24 family protein